MITAQFAPESSVLVLVPIAVAKQTSELTLEGAAEVEPLSLLPAFDRVTMGERGDAAQL